MRNHPNWKIIELFIYIIIVVVSVILLLTSNGTSKESIDTNTSRVGGTQSVIVSGK